MKKQYSLLKGDFSRIHPIATVCILALIIALFTEGSIKAIAATVFVVLLIFFIVWLYREMKAE